jgi:pimeloyl-ACP methyl ester carboxylesterase
MLQVSLDISFPYFVKNSATKFMPTIAKEIPTSQFERCQWQWQGHQICYTVMGEGQPLLLIHGFGASIGHWRKNIPILAAAGYQVYAIDLLGFGNSDKPALEYSLELWQQLLRDFWQEKIQKPTVLIGNSIGALLALMLVADNPELSAGGVLLNVAGGLNHRPDELNYPLRWIMGAFTKLVSSPITGKFLFDRVRQKHRIRGTLSQVYRNPDAITDELVEILYQPSCDTGAQKVFASVLTAPAGRKPEQLLPLVERPLLVLWGEADPWTPFKAAKIYQEYSLTKNIQVVAIANTGHCPHDERPEIVNPLIVDWLSKLIF